MIRHLIVQLSGASPGCVAKYSGRHFALGTSSVYGAADRRSSSVSKARSRSRLGGSQRQMFPLSPGQTRRQVSSTAAAQLEEAPDASVATNTVVFRTCHGVQFGEVLKVVGDAPQLGSWDAAAAPGMTWSEGDNWSLSVELPVGAYVFKCVVYNTGTGGTIWEQGPDRILEIFTCGSSEVVCDWNNTTATLFMADEIPIAATMDQSTLSSEEEDDRVDITMELPAGLMGGTVSGTSSDEDSLLLEYMSDETDDLAEDNNKETLQKEAAALSVGNASSSSAYGTNGNRATGNGNGSSNGNGAVFAPRTTQSGSTDTAEQDAVPGAVLAAVSESTTNGEASRPAGGVDDGSAEEWSSALLVTALAGLLAFPIVAFSQYTLWQTGCGLPPGPSGALGAAEGVSYLLVGGIVSWSIIRKVSKGEGLPAGPGGLLGAVEGMSYMLILTGAIVLGLQIQEYGYIPSALPDDKCFGEGAPAVNLPSFSLPPFQLPTSLGADFQIPPVSLPSFELPDFSGVQLPEVALPAVDMPDLSDFKFQTPDFSAISNNLPSISVPKVDLPDLSNFKFQSPDLSAMADNLPSISVPNVEFPDFSNFKFQTPDFSAVSNNLPSISVPNVDLSDFSLPEIDTSKLSIPSFDLPTLPEVSLPNIELPDSSQLSELAAPIRSAIDRMK